MSAAAEAIFGKGGPSGGPHGGQAQSSEADKMRLCRENFDAAKLAFMQVN